MSAQLNFEIENQIITRTDSFQPVAKSQNYLRASFTFSEDWGDDDKIAIFKTGGKSYEVILDADGECVVPWEALTMVGNVYVSAYSGDRVTASVAKVPVIKTGYVDDPTSTEDPSIDVYQQLKAQIQDVQDDIPDLIDDALSSAKLSDFTNDVGFITENDIPAPNWEAISGEDGYIANKPKIMAGTGTGSLRNSNSTAGGRYSFAEGNSSASGDYAHSEGELTKAVKNGSHAEGYNTVTSGSYSHAEGTGTIANHKSQHVFGEYNIIDSGRGASTTRGTYVEIVGNGESSDAKSNARTLDWEGNQWIAGNMKVGGTGYDDPNAKEVATKEYVDDAIADIPTESEIDDTAGAGDTDKTWSADKIASELANAGSVQDVRINGTSVVGQYGVAEIPVADTSALGVVKSESDGGVYVDTDGTVKISIPSTAVIKAGTNTKKPIVPYHQHTATFYGLAKAAGDTTQSSSSNPIGTYTDNAKASIKAMLGVGGETQKVTVSGTAPVIVANQNTRYVCGEVVSLDFTPSAEGICDVIFTSGSTVTVLTIPNTVIFPEWFDPTTLEANKTYEISVSDGVYGAVMVW